MANEGIPPGDGRSHGQKLLALTDRLCEPLSLDQVVHIIVDEAVGATDADTGALWTVDDGARRANIVRSLGYEADHSASFQSVPLAPWLPMGDALLKREALFFECRADYGARYPEAEKASRSWRNFEELAYACLPLVVGGRSIAGVSIVYQHEHVFDGDERRS
jgi:GAF domain-containing protein